jgi:CDP-paratose 2-epimerase
VKLLITGSSGLIGSEVAEFFLQRQDEVHGLDNNQRAIFFGSAGDTNWRRQSIQDAYGQFCHHELDVRDRAGILTLFEELKPDAIVHAAAQPSHDLAAQIPFDDFDTNAVGTLNLLEAARRHCPDSPFVFLSTNKVYGDGPNRVQLTETEHRWDYADETFRDGIDETFSVDQCLHSLFGASKASADFLVQEYGRYFDMPTCCLRAGCLTGPNHSGVELHGFLSYLVRCNLTETEYTIFGYKGKQVRDNIHASDIARFIECFIEKPRPGEVYNIGGGRANSCSILEAFRMTEDITGISQVSRYVDDPRKGDHICYISDMTRIRNHFPEWQLEISLPQILEEIVAAWQHRLSDAEPGQSQE